MVISRQRRIALAHLVPADVLWSFAPHSPFTSPEDNHSCEGLIVVLLPPIVLCISSSRKQFQRSVRNCAITSAFVIDDCSHSHIQNKMRFLDLDWTFKYK